jgi:hypothetical protein
MPQPPVPAKGAPLLLTRRGLLAGTTSLAATALGSAAPLAALPTHGDAELTALGLRFEQALGVHAAAQAHFNAYERRYLDEGPDPPQILTSAGPLGDLIEDWDHWSAYELRDLLRDPDSSDSWHDAGEALRAAIAYEARERRLRRKLGLRPAERAHEAASDAMDELGALILAAPAHSLGAFALKGRAVKAWGKPEWWSAEASHADTYERIAAEIIDGVNASAV